MIWRLVALSLWATTGQADHELIGRDITAGRALYADHCAVCHGADLEGQPDWRTPDENGILPAPPHDRTGHTWHHDTGLLFEYTRLGGQGALAARGVTGFASGMPGFEGIIPDAGILDILAYIRSTWPAHEQQVQASRNPQH